MIKTGINTRVFTTMVILITIGLLIASFTTCNNSLQEIILTDIQGDFPKIVVKQGDTEIPNGGIYEITGVPEGSSIEVDFTIENSGQIDLQLTGAERVTLSGDEYFVLSTLQPDFTIPPGESAAFSVQFSPPNIELRTSTITITNNDPDQGDYSITLSGNGEVIAVTDISLSKNSTSILISYTEQLDATILPSNATNKHVIWESDNESVASVGSNGLVTALTEGTVIIMVTSGDGGFTDTCEVSTIPIDVSGVSLNTNTATITLGNTEQLIATVEPTDATDKLVSWESDNESVATVNSSGLISTVAPGTATITAITNEGSYTDTCLVQVFAPGGQQNYSLTVLMQTVSFLLNYVPEHTFPTGTDDSGTATVSDGFLIGETEVTFELWDGIRQYAEGYLSYNISNNGTLGDDGSGSSQEPVTEINWRDAIVWSNALTEVYNDVNGTNFTFVYKDTGTPIRDSSDTNAAQCDNVTPDPDADGFRLLTSDEWELAARWRDNSTNTVAGYSDPWFTKGNSASDAYTYHNDESDINPVNGMVDGKDTNDEVAVYGYYWDGDWVLTGGADTDTAVVKSKAANSLSLYDMSGNVSEWCFDWHQDYIGSRRLTHGGGHAVSANKLQVGDLEDGSPQFEFWYMGLRIGKNP
jgi:hypothetical protein